VKRPVRHAVLGFAGCVAAAIVAGIFRDHGWAFRISMGTAYAALIFLTVTLSLGPWYALSEQRRPVSTHLRRDIAIWSALFALAHIAAGLQVHFGGRMANYFFNVEGAAVLPRYDVFGATNYIGLIVGIGVLVLLVISNDASVRSMGLEKWRRFQSLAPWIGALTIVHAFIYQVLEKRSAVFVALIASMAIIVLTLRWLRASRLRSDETKERAEHEKEPARGAE
jgi:DMSO/TMAO reductase YedYZ heme-binding membrane subunit